MSGYTEIALLQYELEKLRSELAEKDAEVEKLKRLNSSYSSLTKAQEGQLTALRNRLYELRGADKTLDSEREANAILTEQLAALKTENESLKRDTERYQWLKSQEPSKHDGYAIGYFDACGVDAWSMTTKDLDQAIDAARGKEKQNEHSN